jgi:hypothetical protein
MGSSGSEISPTPEVRETVTMGEAAKLLGVSVRTVRQMCKAFDDDPEVGLPYAWTSPLMGRTDRNGHVLRGHRRPFASSVRELARASGRLPEES